MKTSNQYSLETSIYVVVLIEATALKRDTNKLYGVDGNGGKEEKYHWKSGIKIFMAKKGVNRLYSYFVPAGFVEQLNNKNSVHVC